MLPLLKNASVVFSLFAFAACALTLTFLPAVWVFAQPPQAQTQQQKDLVRADAALSAVQKRVALVIGNKDYENAPLKNPVNDAESMAAALKDLGFEVILKTNVTKRQMKDAVDEFAAKLGPNCIGLFYFSGHGVQVDGTNYLVPLGYHIARQADVEDEAYPAQRLLNTMGETGCKCNIVILDACRNNPLPKSLKGAGDKGLGKMDAPSGTFIAYATAPGQTASDDSDKNNGLYTGVLLQKMKTPGLKIEEVFKATLVSVAEASGEKQVPWVESSLRNDFYFAAGLPNPAPVPEVVPGGGKVVDTKGRLAVSVTDSKGVAISGATVTVDNQAAPGGSYSINLLDETQKAVTVKVTAPGFEGKLVEGATVLRGKTVSLPVVLEAVAAPSPAPVPVPLVPVSPPPVVARRNVNPKDGAELVLIPAGQFLMGDEDTLPISGSNPHRKVTIPAYSIYKNLVTVAMYEKFCTETGRKMPPAPRFNTGWSKKEHPMVNVSWHDAKAYCDWAGTVLPSEAQWEKAARGTEGRKFPWGDTFDTSKLWCSKSSFGDAGGTIAVGSFPSGASPRGVLDMAGNVWQWCDDWNGKTHKPIRGGSWKMNDADFFRCAFRNAGTLDGGSYDFGFRCVASP